MENLGKNIPCPGLDPKGAPPCCSWGALPLEPVRWKQEVQADCIRSQRRWDSVAHWLTDWSSPVFLTDAIPTDKVAMRRMTLKDYHEWWVAYNLEVDGRGLFQITTLSFVWKHRGELSQRIYGYPAKSLSRYFINTCQLCGCISLVHEVTGQYNYITDYI